MRIGYLALAFLATALPCVPSARGDYYPCRQATRGYVSPCYTPTYNAPTYYAQDYYQDVIVLPKAIKVQVRPDYYFSVGDEYRQAAFARLVAQEYAAIQAQTVQPAAKPATPAVGPSPAPMIPPATVPATPIPSKEPAPAKDPGPQVRAVPLADADLCKPVVSPLPQGFRELVQSHCQKCHIEGKKGYAKFDLTNLDTLGSFSVAKRTLMAHAVTSGQMPQGGEVTQAELDMFSAYATLGWRALVGKQ